MGLFRVNPDGSVSCVFGKDKSKPGTGAAIQVPVGDYNARIIEFKVTSGKAQGPEGASQSVLIQAKIWDPEEKDGFPCKDQILTTYVIPPETKPDGSDKAVTFTGWAGLMDALNAAYADEPDLDSVGEQDEVQFTRERILGLDCSFHVYDDVYNNKTRRKATLMGRPFVGEETGAPPEAAPEAAPEPELAPAPVAAPVPAARPAPVTRAAAAPARAAAPAARTAPARTAAPPPRRR